MTKQCAFFVLFCFVVVVFFIIIIIIYLFNFFFFLLFFFQVLLYQVKTVVMCVSKSGPCYNELCFKEVIISKKTAFSKAHICF